jgi:glycerol-3-phosphate responsive antiterminator
MKNTKSQIIETLKNLIEAREIIFSQIVNLAMTGEMKHIDEVLEIGDSYNFELKHFTDVEDFNVKKLVDLCKKTEKTIFTIMDLNGISENEVGM